MFRWWNRFFSLIVLILFLPAGIMTVQAQTADHIVIYANNAGQIIALNPQTGLKTILLTIESPLERAYGFYVSPDGIHLGVFLRLIDQNNATNPLQFRLYVVRIADAALLLDQDLLPPGYVYPSPENPGDPQYELARAQGEVVWSRDGRYLAFISAQAGNADVFIFEPATQIVTQLNNAPGTAAFITWNPSGSLLVFCDLNSFGTGSGYDINTYYAVSVPEGETRPLPEPVSVSGFSAVGWLDDTTLIYSPLDFAFFGAAGLYTLDMNSLVSTERLPPRVAMNVPVFDDLSKSIAFVVPEIGEVSLVPGAYLWLSDEAAPTLLQSGTFYAVNLVRPGQFQFEDPSGSYLAGANGSELSPLPANDFGAFVSPGMDAVAL
ncbi:MAG TPA: hypothetical protein VJZ27_08800, partial [Aggregatilineales bacterium]|nr:hypothetical protein [Aggregatilineales bacterium]